MKAILVEEFGEPGVLQLGDLPVPRPGRGQVLLRVRAAGVNPVDTYIRSGSYARKPSLPYTPGSDSAGEVEEVGEDVSNFRAGDRIYTAGTVSGAYAEFALCDAAQGLCLPCRGQFFTF